MAFYNAMQLKSNGKWYPQAVQVDQPFSTDEVADRLAQISTDPGTGEDTGSDGSFG